MGLYQPTSNFLHSEGNHQHMKRQATKWKEIFTNGTFNKGLMFKIDKAMIQFNTKIFY